MSYRPFFKAAAALGIGIVLGVLGQKGRDYPRFIYEADINNDGKPDLVIQTYSNDVVTFLGKPDGGYISLNEPREIRANGLKDNDVALYRHLAEDFVKSKR